MLRSAAASEQLMHVSADGNCSALTRTRAAVRNVEQWAAEAASFAAQQPALLETQLKTRQWQQKANVLQAESHSLRASLASYSNQMAVIRAGMSACAKEEKRSVSMRQQQLTNALAAVDAQTEELKALHEATLDV